MARFPREQVLIVPASVWKGDMQVTAPIVKAGKVATPAEKALAYKARKLKAVVAAEVAYNRPFRTKKGRLMDGEAEAALLCLWGSRMPQDVRLG